MFYRTNVDYLPEDVFKPYLNNSKNLIINKYENTPYYSTIDCTNCRNYWLVKDQKFEKQVTHTRCQGDQVKSLFDQDVKTKLSQKCK